MSETKVHNAGDASVPIPAGVIVKARYGGPGDCYRYMLDWKWGDGATLMAAMMNPSTASHLVSDRTINWVYRWAVRSEYGRMLIVNADAYRAADQMRLAEVADPCGPDNVAYILSCAAASDTIVLGYGLPKVKAVRDHGKRMERILYTNGYDLYAWALTKDGTPKHPLYLPGDSVLIPYRFATTA